MTRQEINNMFYEGAIGIELYYQLLEKFDK